ncbi:binding-protein-dependent transport system inner membrane component, partial [mine drainage metagenome]
QPLARVGTVVMAALILFVFLGPLVYRHSVTHLHILDLMQPPSLTFPLGTDELGRNVFARLMVGGQMSLEVGFVAAFAGMAIGIAYGMVAGLVGGWIDAILMRIVDLLRSIPGLFLLIFLDSVFRPSAGLLIILIAAVSWHGVARLVRGEVLSLKSQLYVEAAEAMGASRLRIIVRHLFPNALGTILVVH